MQVILIQHLWDRSFQIQPPGPSRDPSCFLQFLVGQASHWWEVSVQVAKLSCQTPQPIPDLTFMQPYHEPVFIASTLNYPEYPSFMFLLAPDATLLGITVPCDHWKNGSHFSSWQACVSLSHLVASDCRFISERNHRVPLKAETGA